MRERVQRNGMIDIWRFIFALLIMGHHMYHLDIGESYLFQSAWIYVEFFFMLSGYFTAKHFLWGGWYIQYTEKDGAKEAVLYTLNKMKKIIPYTTIFILTEYIIRNLNYDWKSLRGFLGGFEDSIFELLLLSSSGVVNARLAPVWYLSAMFLVLPIFCYLIRTKEKLTVYILSWSIPIIYYGKMGVVPRAPWPHDMLRAFSCMMLGVVVYDLGEWIRKFEINRLTRICLTVIEAGCFISTVILTGRNSGRMKLILILLITGIIVMLPEQSYSANLRYQVF